MEMKKHKLNQYLFAVNRATMDNVEMKATAESIEASVWPKVKSAEALYQNFAAGDRGSARG